MKASVLSTSLLGIPVVSSKELKRVRRVASGKRNRAILSCAKCKKMKVKCSDARPCNRCLSLAEIESCIKYSKVTLQHEFLIRSRFFLDTPYENRLASIQRNTALQTVWHFRGISIPPFYPEFCIKTCRSRLNLISSFENRQNIIWLLKGHIRGRIQSRWVIDHFSAKWC